MRTSFDLGFRHLLPTEVSALVFTVGAPPSNAIRTGFGLEWPTRSSTLVDRSGHFRETKEVV